MKIAVMSDVHANSTYLECFFEDSRKQGAEMVLCCGDLVGYYDQPNAVLTRLRESGICCVKGNHDKYFLGELDYDLNRDHVYGIGSHRKKVSEINRFFLKNLPDSRTLEIAGLRFYMTHSLPNDPVSYCYDPPEIDPTLNESIDFYLYGHTHVPKVASKDGVWFVNPGSVGQPRDYSRKGAYAMIETTSRTIDLCHFYVDVEGLCQTLEADNYDASLIEILRRNDGQRK